MSLLGFEPRTPASLRVKTPAGFYESSNQYWASRPARYNPNGLCSYKSSALNQAELQAHFIRLYSDETLHLYLEIS